MYSSMGQKNLQAKILALETTAFLFLTSVFGYGGYYRANKDFAQMPPEARVFVICGNFEATA